MTRAVIFDCFGVLATDGWLPFKQHYFGHDPQLMQEAGDLLKQVDAGLADHNEFVTQVAKLAGVERQVAVQAIDNNMPNEQLFEFIKSLKPHYKIGMLSNAGNNWLNEMFSPEQVKLFDAVALSYETGHIKPYPQAYQSITDRLGVKATECIFVDDQRAYGEAAEVEGMTFVWYQSPEQTIEDIRALLADS